MALGIYISVPFCRTKCSYCNFASDVFSRAVFERYVDRVCADIGHASAIAAEMGGRIEREVDSIYLGGGTPTVLEAGQLQRMFDAVRAQFAVLADAEVTVECAPGTLTPEVLDELAALWRESRQPGRAVVYRREAAAVGRLHKRATVLDDIRRLRAAGITNINVDLIAGLPHQTAESWQESVEQRRSRRGLRTSASTCSKWTKTRAWDAKLIAGGTRYHAHFVPDEEATADFYVDGVRKAGSGGGDAVRDFEFRRAGFESRHNLKYWTRQPYFGFGVDAHSMLASAVSGVEAVRFATTDALEKYVAGSPPQKTDVSRVAALEECFFLGLRLNRGVDLRDVSAEFGVQSLDDVRPAIAELVADQLILQDGDCIRLTPRGRLLSNEVFERFLAPVRRSTQT